MSLLTLVNALLTLNIRVSVQKADALYKALGLDQMAADLKYYRGECQRLNAKLTGATPHNSLVETALHSASIIDNLANGKKIQAIADLRRIAGCTIKEAKDVIEDRRVTYRATLLEWERDQLS